MNRTIAGPTLRALASAAVGRLLVQLDGGQSIADYSRSGVLKDEVDGVTVRTSNVITVEPPDVQSRLTWEIEHELWALRFTERRALGEDGIFVKTAPHQVILEGDLTEAARYLGIPRELFYEALRADGWSHAAITIEALRWLKIPYFWDQRSLKETMLAL